MLLIVYLVFFIISVFMLKRVNILRFGNELGDVVSVMFYVYGKYSSYVFIGLLK